MFTEKVNLFKALGLTINIQSQKKICKDYKKL